jgi:hypothetical protein
MSSCGSPSGRLQGSILGASNSTVLRPFKKVLAKEVRGKHIMYQDAAIAPAGSSSSFHYQHQLQYGHPCHLSNPAHQHHLPTWQWTVIQNYAPPQPLVGLRDSYQIAAFHHPPLSNLASLLLPSELSDDSSDDASKLQYLVQLGTNSHHSLASFCSKR